MRDDMLSALARSQEGRSLIEFCETNSIAMDWSKLEEQQITAMVSGNKLGNAVGNLFILNDGRSFNTEYLIHLFGPQSTCLVNLATIIAMAAAYCRSQNSLASKFVAQFTKAKRALRGGTKQLGIANSEHVK